MSADQPAPEADESASDSPGEPNPNTIADPEASFLDDPDLPDAVKRALRDSGKQAIDRMKAERNAAKAMAEDWKTKFESLQKSQMSDQEKAIEEARTAGRTEALTEVGSKIAKAEFKAAIAGRLEGDTLDAFLGGLDLKAFLDADGEVDGQKVQTYVNSVLPATNGAPVDFGQGARGSNTQIEMDPKKLAERVRPSW